MSDTFPDETLYPVLEALADEDRIFASNSAVSHESSQIKGSTIKGLINALKGTPPETLDTLQKLAAAINDDPAFHTTLATALAGKAPLASPALTGTPTAPTAALGTNTTQIATTAFCESYGRKWTYSYTGVGGAISAVPWTMHAFGASGTLTLPLASSVASGVQIAAIVAYGGAECVLTRSGSDQFVTPTGLATTYTLRGNGSSIVLVRVTASAWACVGAPDSLIAAAIAAAKVSPALTGTPTAPTAAVGTNTTQLATTAFVQAALTGAAGVPAGVICMWSGTIATVPTGWSLCDGANGTPDLVDRFVVAAGSKAGGDKYDPGDTGGADSVTLDLTQVPAHTHAGTTGGGGAHGHDVYYWDGTSTGSGPMIDKRDNVNNNWDALSSPVSPVSDHAHGFTTDSKGGGGSHENRPPYYALAFIMKL